MRSILACQLLIVSMNIQQIAYILAVDELHNFGLAAQKCHITQSTLSTMVARFEDEIGITIFNRKKKPVMATKEGQKVIQQLKIIHNEFENLHGVIQSLKGELQGEVKIGIIPTIAPYLLPRFLPDFIQKYPGLHFVVSEMTTAKISTQLENRELDVGIVSIPLKHPDCEEVLLYEEPFLLYDSMHKSSGKPLDLNDLDFNRLWLLEEGHCMRTQVEQICSLHERQNIKRNLDYQSGSIDALVRFVNANQGVTLLPYLATLDLSEREKQGLQVFQAPIPSRAIGLIFHQHFVKRGILIALEREIKRKVGEVFKAMTNHKNVQPVLPK